MDNHKASRWTFYLLGLFIMTLGVSFSVKSALGVSPISSVPYTMTVVWGIDLGIATTIFSVIAALLQVPILRKGYRAVDLLQIPISIVFGLFMTGCQAVFRMFPDPSAMWIQVLLMLLSTLVVAVGVFMYVSSGLIPLPTEGFLIAITRVTDMKFSTLKIIGDVSMVLISVVTCFLTIHDWGSIGVGTVVSALLIGTEVKILSRFFGKKVGELCGREDQKTQ